MQNSIHTPVLKVYKRSQSGGRNMTTLETDRFHQIDTMTEIERKAIENDRNHSLIYRRSLGRSRYDNENIPEMKTRSSSVCRVSDDFCKSLCSTYSSDVSDKYKYYSPYVAKGKESGSSSLSPQTRYESISPRENCFSPTRDFNAHSLTECFSPTSEGTGNTTSHRRYSRYLQQDSDGASYEDNRPVPEKKYRDRESQSVLREIKEKSRESSRDRLSQSMELDPAHVEPDGKPEISAHHVRNKSLEMYYDVNESRKEIPNHSRHASRSRDLSECNLKKEELASKILEELQTLPSVKTQKEKHYEISSNASKEVAPENVVKKVRKIKPKAKSVDSIAGSEVIAATESKTTAVKKVKKVVKRTEIKGEEKTGNFEPESRTSKSDLEKPKRGSKLKRPKSFPIKDTDKVLSTIANGNILDSAKNESKIPLVKTAATTSPESGTEDLRLIRPKSYPASKLTPPKDIKRILPGLMEKPLIEGLIRQIPKRSSLTDDKSIVAITAKSSDSASPTEPKPTTINKIVKVSRKSKITSPMLTPKSMPDPKIRSKENSPSGVSPLKEKSPEKKSGKGLLYAIGQKFEKLRDSAKYKEKKIVAKVTTSANALSQKTPDESKEKVNLLKNKKAKSVAECYPIEKADDKAEEKAIKTENRRSRIDAMIRSLRERSLPRTPILTESTLIKRAVSVEEMPGTFNKCAVNRVLGLFKRFEKDGSDRKVRSTRSTSNIERQMHKFDSPINQSSDRPKSSGFLSKLSKNSNLALVNRSEDFKAPQIAAKKKEISNSSEMLSQPTNTCPECNHEQTPETNVLAKNAAEKEKEPVSTSVSKECVKDKRKALVLDFTKLDHIDNKLATTIRETSSINGNSLPITSHHDNAFNNNNIKSSSNEINRNHVFTPPNDNANASSDSKSYHDDCGSTSTFLSPTDEPELCFDNWSVCSEDNYMFATPSPTVSRLSRTSHYSSPTHPSDGNESVIDRIKRRSFYSRFNEKRPKRQSTIVGPAARGYYRESASSSNKSKPTDERQPSPDITKEFFKPLKLSPAGSELKQPVYRSTTADSNSKPSSRRRLDNLHSSTSSSYLSMRYITDNDYLLSSTRAKSNTAYDHNSSTQPTSYYNTYNPKRRSSYNLNGSIPGSTIPSHNVDGYATVGRRSNLRSYDHRTMSLLDPIGQSSTSMIGTYRRDYRTPISDLGSLNRSRFNYRSASATRSPTNI